MTGLFDREAELGRLSLLVDAVRGGSGRVAVIEGPSGIGKSAVLHGLREVAIAQGCTTQLARCGEFERELAFGAARQLLRPEPGTAADSALSEEPAGAAVTDFQAFHSLYWICVSAAMQQPLLLAVDDAHWADAASLGWLRYLVRRIDDVPVLVVLTVRSDEAAATNPVIKDILAADATTEVLLGPLSAPACGQILEHVFGEEPDPAFLDACHRATGGNPFLATELARALAEEGGAPHGDQVWRIGSLRPQSIVRSIDTRLRRLSGDAQAMAQAAAVFGVEAEFRHAAALAGLRAEAAFEAADALHRARIIASIDPLRFEHSVTRDAILGDLSPARLARDHKRAADVLAGEGAAADRVASHLLLSTPLADAGTVRWLTRAADSALLRGAPEPACAYLERALIEPPPASDRWSLMWSLGRAEALLARPTARDRLSQAYEECPDPAQRALVAADLVSATAALGRLAEAYDILDREIAEVAPLDRERGLALECQLLTSAQLDHELTARARVRASALEGLPGETPAERAVLAVVAYIRSSDATAHSRVLELATAAYNCGAILDDDPLEIGALGYLARCFTNLGSVEPAEALVQQCLDLARRRGSLAAHAGSLLAQAALAYTVGDLAAASDDANAAAALLEGSGLLGQTAATAALRVAVLIDRGALDEAEALLSSLGLQGPIPAFGVLDQLLYYRGVLRRELGAVDDAVADLFELGRRESVAGYHFAVTQWRTAAAPLLAAIGRDDEAHTLLDEELAIARRRGSPRPMANTLRARAAVVRGTAAVDLLEEACELLAPTPFALDRARTEAALGGALRRANQRAEARPHLEEALDLAFRCGATALASAVRAELRAAGARPRRPARTGPEALTTSERRVAELAASGRSNPEIAQALFVSRKTVETHLGRAYQKLGITDRRMLPDALAVGQRSGTLPDVADGVRNVRSS